MTQGEDQTESRDSIEHACLAIVVQLLLFWLSCLWGSPHWWASLGIVFAGIPTLVGDFGFTKNSKYNKNMYYIKSGKICHGMSENLILTIKCGRTPTLVGDFDRCVFAHPLIGVPFWDSYLPKSRHWRAKLDRANTTKTAKTTRAIKTAKIIKL